MGNTGKGIGAGAGGIGGAIIGGPVGAAIGSGVGGLIGGALDGGNDEVNYDAPDLDQGTKDMITSGFNRAQRTDSEFRDDLLSGTDKTQALNSANEAANARTGALGGEAGQMSEALTQRASRSYSRGQADLSRKANVQEPLNRFSASQVAQQNALSWKMIETERARRLFQQKADQDAARNKVISDILGVGGVIAGAAVGRKASKDEDPGTSLFGPGGIGGAGNSPIRNIDMPSEGTPFDEELA